MAVCASLPVTFGPDPNPIGIDGAGAKKLQLFFGNNRRVAYSVNRECDYLLPSRGRERCPSIGFQF
jgi:hypothetical protein